MRRGEIWWAVLEPPRNTRPVLLVTRDTAYGHRTHVTIAPLTRSARKIPSHVSVGPSDGVPTDSVINVDDLQTIPMVQLQRRITELTPLKMAEVDGAIKFALALP